MFFTCEYGDSFIHEVWAENADEAKAIVNRFRFSFLGLCRRPVSEYRPSILARQPGGLNRDDVLHSLCFLTFLAQRLSIVSPDDACGDEGPLHSLIHFRQIGALDPRKFKRQIARGITFLEANIPGIPPAHIILPELILSQGATDDLNDPFTVSDWL